MAYANDPQLQKAMRDLSKEIGAIGKKVKTLEVGQRQAQLPYSTIDDGALKVANSDGSTMIIGKQPDGSSAITTQATPPPPQPSTPLVFATIEGATATWDGFDLTGDTMPASFDHVEVHASTASGFEPTPNTKMGIIPRVSGSFPITGLTAGETYYVRLVAVSASLSSSLPSVQASVVPLEAPAGAGGDTEPPGVPAVSGTIPVQSYTDPTGDARSRATVSWTAPTTNADGSELDDGAYFEVQYRQTSPSGIAFASVFVAWGTTTATIPELIPGVTYEFQVRAVDTSGNAGAWSVPVSQLTAVDTDAPSTPSAPTVAASITAVQVTHHLTNDTGHALEDDLDHLDVYIGTTSGFLPDASTLAGSLSANQGMIDAGLWVVGTFQVASTAKVYVRVVAVDKSGNASSPSVSASTTAVLIDSAHISDLTASKISAGTMGADVVISGSFSTAETGERSVMDALGFHAFDASGTETFRVSGGDVSVIGEIASGPAGTDRVVINPNDDAQYDPNGNKIPEIRFVPSSQPGNFARIWSHPSDVAGQATLRIDSGATPDGTLLTSMFQASDYLHFGTFGYDVDNLNVGGHLILNNTAAQMTAYDSAGALKAGFTITVDGMYDAVYPYWYATAYYNGWKTRVDSSGNPFQALRYKRMPFNALWIHGEIAPGTLNPTGGVQVAGLAAGLRPARNVAVPVTLGGVDVPNMTRIPSASINADGNVMVYYAPSGTSFVQFDSIVPLD